MLTLSKVNDNEYVWWDTKILHTGPKTSSIAYGYWLHGIEKDTIKHAMEIIEGGFRIEFTNNRTFTRKKILTDN